MDLRRNCLAPCLKYLLNGLLIVGISIGSTVPASGQNRLSLAGEWQLRLDPTDKGLREHWWLQPFDDRVQLPGSLTENNRGDTVSLQTPWVGSVSDSSYFYDDRYKKYREGRIKIPFWLKPTRYYAGPAWYKREVTVSPDWTGRRTTLMLERCHWQTIVYVNGAYCGSRNTLVAAHTFDLTGVLRPGKNTIVVRVDNRIGINIGVNSHSISDNTQTNWNGLVGELSLTAGSPVYVADTQIYPDLRSQTIRVTTVLHQPHRQTFRGKIRLRARLLGPDSLALPVLEQPVSVTADATNLTATYAMPNPRLWDEFTPTRYQLTVQVVDEQGQPLAEDQQVFGMREIGTRGTRFTLNGRPIFLRGEVECAAFPLTGYPPTTEPYWEKIMTTLRQYGLNHLRFHSWCPPKAAFDVADRLGIYLYVESPLWANQGSAVGTGGLVDTFIYDESERILREYGNHPSFCMMSYGNEPDGINRDAFLGRWVDHFKQRDPRRLFTSGAGWPVIPENQFHIDPTARIQPWGAGISSIINKGLPRTDFDWRTIIAPYNVPYISHEIGEWSAYPNFAEIPKYTGVLKATNYEIFRDFLTDAGMGNLASAFLHASGRLQTLCYKADIEAALRTPGIGGFHLLGLHDFPGQGTTPVGVLDVFWDAKGYTTPYEYRQFCSPTVLLARMPKLIYENSDILNATLEIAHFGATERYNQTVVWTVQDAAGKRYQSGQLTKDTVRLDNAQRIGAIHLPLAAIKKPTQLKLVVQLKGTAITNSWDFWVYPARLDPAVAQRQVIVTHELTPAIEAQLQAGARVLLLSFGQVKTDKGGRVVMGFSPVFWNTSWTQNQAPHTLGLLCQPTHPLFADFPTEASSNYQWQPIVSHAQVMLLDGFPKSLRPLIQPIDDWNKSRRLALAFEGAVGKGKLLVCSADLDTDLTSRPSVRQLRYSLLRYMNGSRFQPTDTLSIADVKALFRASPPREQVR